MSKTILVACRLPSGLVLDGYDGQPLLLNGQNTAFVPGAPGLTHVDETQWQYLAATYAEHVSFKTGAIFTTGSDKVADIADAAEDLKGEKTGFEGLDPSKPGSKLAPADETKLSEALDIAASTAAVPRRSVAKKDRAAAIELAAS